MTDSETMDFFRDDSLVADPYPYLEALRSKCPVYREPHHDVMLVSGYDEAVTVLGDAGSFSSCLSVQPTAATTSTSRPSSCAA